MSFELVDLDHMAVQTGLRLCDTARENVCRAANPKSPWWVH